MNDEGKTIEPGIQGELPFKVGYRGINSDDIDDATLERRKEELGYVLFSSMRAINGFINMVKGINVDSVKSQNARIQSEHDQVQLDYEYFRPERLLNWSDKYMLPIPGYGACVFGQGDIEYELYLDWFFDRDVDWDSLN